MAKPIEQQVAELTNEQRSSIKSIYKKMVIVEICCIIIGLIISACSFVFVAVKAEEAKDRYEMLETQQALNEMNGTFSFALSDEEMEAMDEYYDYKGIQIFSLLPGLGLSLIGIIVSYCIMKAKYPYYSEGKYKYLRNSGYYNAPQQGVAPQNYNQNYPQHRQ